MYLAKSSTAGIYKPLLLGSNALYILLLIVWNQPSSWGISFILGMLITWGLQIYSYLGILDHAANVNIGNKKKGSSGGNNNKNDLIGGINLDLLALTVVVQYGTALHSSKWYWLILIVPIYGGWSLYQTYYGSSSSKSNNKTTAEGEEISDDVKQRREKRAEKRRQKWS